MINHALTDDNQPDPLRDARNGRAEGEKDTQYEYYII